MDTILIITYLLLAVSFVLYGGQIGQEGFKSATLNPNTTSMIFLLIFGFFLATGMVKTQDLDDLIGKILIILFIFSIILFRVRFIRRVSKSQILFSTAKGYNEHIASEIYTDGNRGDPAKIEIYRNKRKIIEIEKYYKKAIELEAREGDVLNVAIGYLQLGYYYRTLEYCDKAEDTLYKSLEILKDLNYESPDNESILSSLAIVFSRLGELSHVKGEYKEALKRYEESLEIDQKLGNEQGVRTVSILMRRIEEEA